jgi:hypothetical protein
MKPRRGIGCDLPSTPRYNPPYRPWYSPERVLGALGLLLILGTLVYHFSPQEEFKSCSGFGPPPGWHDGIEEK